LLILVGLRRNDRRRTVSVVGEATQVPGTIEEIGTVIDEA
jgi:hypothetical protein